MLWVIKIKKMESIIHEIFRGIALTKNEMQQILNNLEKITLKKGAFLLKADQEVNGN